MQWSDDDDGKMAVISGDQKQHMAVKTMATVLHDGGVLPTMMGDPAAHLHFKTAAEDAKHMKACKDMECQWCRTTQFLGKFQTAFQVVEDGLMESPQYRCLNERDKALAGTMWLGKGHRGDDVVLGCIVCRALQDPRMMTNALAGYVVPASRLFEATGKPHVFLRHSKTALHAKAVCKFLGMDAGRCLVAGPKKRSRLQFLWWAVSWQDGVRARDDTTPRPEASL